MFIKCSYVFDCSLSRYTVQPNPISLCFRMAHSEKKLLSGIGIALLSGYLTLFETESMGATDEFATGWWKSSASE
jgi:hypothetical protein